MKRTNDLLIGAVVLTVIVAVIAAVLWLQQADFGSSKRHVTARFRDVGNITVGDAAVIRGVRGGHVESIELASGGWVHVSMAIDNDVQLPPDPVVLLSEASLFGEWQAMITERDLVPHDAETQQALAEATGARGFLPGATLPGLSKLTAVAGQISGDVANVASRVQVAFDDSAARELRGTFRNVAELSATLDSTVRLHATDLDTLSAGLHATILSLDRAAATAERVAQRVDTASSGGQVAHIVADVSQAAADLRTSSAQISRLTDRLAQTQGRLDVFLARSDSVLAQVNGGRGSLGRLLTDPSLYAHGDSLLVALRALATDIHDNPKKYFSLRIF